MMVEKPLQLEAISSSVRIFHNQTLISSLSQSRLTLVPFQIQVNTQTRKVNFWHFEVWGKYIL